MKTVLITNLYFQKYTGSELHTLEIAKRFSQLGYEVTVATFSKTYPLLKYVDGYTVIEITKEKLERNEFDIVFIQHFPVFDYIVTHYEIKYKYMIVSILSSFNMFETLPTCYKNADLISVVSEECEETIAPYTQKCFLFRNSADRTFFDMFERNKKEKLEHIAIISNHVPEELRQLPALLQNMSFDFLGSGDNQELVTAELLARYDLVITIGRTVQQCFACGTPVYVYDYFGGPGYIESQNIQLAEKHNFSGRGFEKISADSLAELIVDGFDENLKRLNYLHGYASENFCFEKTFDQMLSITLEKEKNDYCRLNNMDSLTERRIKAYSEIFPLTPFLNECYSGNSQLYYMPNTEILEKKNSIRWTYADGYIIDRYFRLTSNGLLRFDPSDKPCRCRIIEIEVDKKIVTDSCFPANSIKFKDGFHYFLTNDSQIFIKVPVNECVRIKYQVFNLNKTEIIQLSEMLQAEKKLLKTRYSEN